MLGKRCILATGKHAVHIQVKQRHAARDRRDPAGIERGVDVDDTVQVLGMLADDVCQLEGNVLALKLVAVNAGHDAGTRQIIACTYRCKAVFPDADALIGKELRAGYF